MSGLLERRCEYCGKKCSTPCETQKQSATCSRNPNHVPKPVAIKVSKEHLKPLLKP